MKTTDGRTLKFLIDSGSNQSYIATKFVKKPQITEPIIVKNVTGDHKIDQYVRFNPFPGSRFSDKIKFYVFDFHNFFDGLIGYEALQKVKAVIVASKNELQLPDLKISMFRKFTGKSLIKIPSGDSKLVEMNTNKKDGDFLVQEDIEISPQVFLRSGLYKQKNNKALVLIENTSKLLLIKFIFVKNYKSRSK